MFLIKDCLSRLLGAHLILQLIKITLFVIVTSIVVGAMIMVMKDTLMVIFVIMIAIYIIQIVPTLLIIMHPTIHTVTLTLTNTPIPISIATQTSIPTPISTPTSITDIPTPIQIMVTLWATLTTPHIALQPKTLFLILS